MIKYCCYYCANFDACRDGGKTVCYPSLGGIDYVQHCEVKDGVCAEIITGDGAMADEHRKCWEEKK